MSQRDQWAEEFGALAASYWTDDALFELLGNKDLPVTPRSAPLLLRALGLLHRDATLPPRERRKFFQLNHMLRLLRPPLEELGGEGPITVVDAGCGRSYLTIALAHCLSDWGISARVLGIDRNAKLIEDCNRRAEMAAVHATMRFAVADLNELELSAIWSTAFGDEPQLDALIALHACDTATDDAIHIGVLANARLIAVAPCCQAELAAGWAELGDHGAFAPIWTTPQLRRNTAATMTDAFRKLLLESAGYHTRVVEFVASQHTPKNTLIRAMRREAVDRAAAVLAYDALKSQTGGVGIKLEQLLNDRGH